MVDPVILNSEIPFEIQEGTPGNLPLLAAEIITLIENDSDLNLSDNVITGDHIAPMSIESEHIESEFLSKLLDIKEYALGDGRLIADTDIESDFEIRLLAAPARPEIQKIGYSGTRANTYSATFGRPEITRITIPSTFRTSTQITSSTDTGLTSILVAPNGFVVSGGPATGLFVIGAIFSNGELGPTRCYF